MSQLALNWQSPAAWIAVSLGISILSYFCCRLAMQLSIRSGMITQPGQRQSHQVATPTGGGLGIVMSLVIGTATLQNFLPFPLFWWKSMLPGVLLLAAVGWLDDRRPVSSRIRLLIQFVVSLWLLGFACFEGTRGDIGLCLTSAVALIWLMNLYNFMDGSNGMAGFQAVFAGLVMTGLFFIGGQYAMALLALMVVAACAGFLPLNFPRAAVFMGDVASVPLGFIFGAFAVYGIQTAVIDLASAILVMAVFIVDATLTLVARVIRGERWYTAHNQHVYQRLIVQEWSHSRVLMVYQAVNVLVVLPAVVLVNMYPRFAMPTTALTLILLGTCWYIANRKLVTRAARRLE
jgi:Fuc2NAc and GlcNAc transferase